MPVSVIVELLAMKLLTAPEVPPRRYKWHWLLRRNCCRIWYLGRYGRGARARPV